MEVSSENIFSNLSLNFPLYLPSRTKAKGGLQSHRVTSDLRQQVSLALERQLGSQLVNTYASSLLNLPISTQDSAVPALNTIPSFPTKPTSKQHPPLTASNSVANCNAASHLKTLITKEHRKLDRSVSEPVDKSQTLRPSPPSSSRYKTELCRPFEESGMCKYGDKCQFAHGLGELRTLSRHPKYKTELCRTFHSTGFCPYGPRCHFIHNSEDSKKCLLTTLQSNGSMSVNGNSSLSPTSLSPPHMSPMEYDICGFSLGSTGDLSPTSSTSSNGSPTSSQNSFFVDDSHSIYSVPQVPQTAPPTLSSGGFFGPDYITLKPLSALSPLIPQELPPSQQVTLEEDAIPSLEMLVSEMELNSIGDPNRNGDSTAKNKSSSAIDISRLPVFNSMSSRSSP